MHSEIISVELKKEVLIYTTENSESIKILHKRLSDEFEEIGNYNTFLRKLNGKAYITIDELVIITESIGLTASEFLEKLGY